ncbi:hypothetical protein DBR11_10415 [Pedobacter sp. HMWF019]|nr:hypothetical protein DBR11_10415 [Pedobacter sp. HMWF019]
MIRSFSADCSVKVPVCLSYGAEAAEKLRTKTKAGMKRTIYVDVILMTVFLNVFFTFKKK